MIVGSENSSFRMSRQAYTEPACPFRLDTLEKAAAGSTPSRPRPFPFWNRFASLSIKAEPTDNGPELQRFCVPPRKCIVPCSTSNPEDRVFLTVATKGLAWRPSVPWTLNTCWKPTITGGQSMWCPIGRHFSTSNT